MCAFLNFRQRRANALLESIPSVAVAFLELFPDFACFERPPEFWEVFVSNGIFDAPEFLRPRHDDHSADYVLRVPRVFVVAFHTRADLSTCVASSGDVGLM